MTKQTPDYVKNLDSIEEKVIMGIPEERFDKDSKTLLERVEGDIEILPKLLKSDINPNIEEEPVSTDFVKTTAIFESIQNTNGICFLKLHYDVASIIPEELKPFLPFFTECLTEFGTDELNSKEFNEMIDL